VEHWIDFLFHEDPPPGCFGMLQESFLQLLWISKFFTFLFFVRGENLRAISSLYVYNRLTWPDVYLCELYSAHPYTYTIVQYVDDILRCTRSMCNIYSILFSTCKKSRMYKILKFVGLARWMTQLSGLFLLSIYCMHHFSTGEKNVKWNKNQPFR
jgi:hypothetical protein